MTDPRGELKALKLRNLTTDQFAAELEAGLPELERRLAAIEEAKRIPDWLWNMRITI